MFIDIKEKIVRFMHNGRNIKKGIDEIIWAEIFNSTISNSEWFRTGISPGRWAVGYPYFYVMYRVLNEIQPESILEIGIGQTTRMIADYLEWNDKAKHIAIEQDSDWIEFVKASLKLRDSKLIVMPTILKEVELDKKRAYVTHYDGFREKVFSALSENGKSKLEFICIDGPTTLSGQTYGASSRRDILEIIPGYLADDFVIMLDDINVRANRKLVKDIMGKLKCKAGEIYAGEY